MSCPNSPRWWPFHRWSLWLPHGSGMLFVMHRTCMKCGENETKVVVV